jgi:hypothetical protein
MTKLETQKLAAKITTQVGKTLKLNNEQSQRVYDVVLQTLQGGKKK